MNDQTWTTLRTATIGALAFLGFIWLTLLSLPMLGTAATLAASTLGAINLHLVLALVMATCTGICIGLALHGPGRWVPGGSYRYR